MKEFECFSVKEDKEKVLSFDSAWTNSVQFWRDSHWREARPGNLGGVALTAGVGFDFGGSAVIGASDWEGGEWLGA